MSQLSSSFAIAFTTALENSGLPANAVAAELTERGYPVDTKTLSAWQRGNTLPLHKAWKPAITQLENILGLAESSLDKALHEDVYSSMGATTTPIPLTPTEGSHPTVTCTQARRHFRELDTSIVWDNEAYRKTMSETIVISEDFCRAESHITLVVQLPAVHKPVIHVSAHLDKNMVSAHDEDYIGVYDVEGATIGETVTKDLDDAVSKTTTLILPPGIPGQLCQISYKQLFVYSEPMTSACNRLFPWPLLYYTCEVTFEGEVPDNPRWEVIIEMDDTDPHPEPTLSCPLTPVGNTVSATLEKPCDMWAVVRWDNKGATAEN